MNVYKYLRKYSKPLNLESLSKATNIREMLAGKNPLQPHQEEFVKWVYDTVPNNDNWRVWLTRHYKNKPEDFTPEIKSKIQHYSSLARISSDVAQVRFDKTHDLHTGLAQLQNAEQKFYNKATVGGKVYPTPTTKFFNKSATPNRAWFHLGVIEDPAEGKAMGHCAKCSSEDAKLLSLRDVIQENGITFHIPRVTASVYEFPDSSFYIGQMKGPQNKKPDPAYHKDIMELLKNPKMVGLVGLEYNPEEDFKFEDLTPEQQQEVLKHNPYFIKNNKEAKIKGQEIAEEIKKDITKLKDLTHGHLSLFKEELNKTLENHPNLLDDPEVVQKLIDSKLSYILAKHPDLFTKAPHIAEKLADDENWYIREQIALNPYLLDKAPYLVEKLANDKEWFVRRAIAEHPDLFTKFPHLVEKFANDEYWSVRYQIAKHPDLFTKFPNLVEKFANDKISDVRYQIAKHPDLFTKFPNLVEKLLNDENLNVRRKLQQNAKEQGIDLTQFLQNLKSQTQKSEKLTVNKYLLLKKAEYQFSKLSKNSESKEIVYVATDGDNIGASVERAAMSNDLSAIKENDRIIRMGNDIIVNWAKMHEGVVYINGGDDVSFYMPKKYIKDLFKLKDEYTKATKFTLTIGVGDTISNALRALVYGKLNGKNQINIYSPAIKEAIEKLKSKKDLSPQEKLQQEGLLKAYTKIFKTYKALQVVSNNSTNLRKDLISSIPIYAPVKELITLNDANKFLRPIVSKKPINASDMQFETYQFVDSKGIPYYVLVVKGLNGFIGDVFKSEVKTQNYIFILNEKLFNLFRPFILKKSHEH